MQTSNKRLDGLDLARGLAMLGMLMVNFRLAMGVEAGADMALGRLFLALEGRSAATFVVLAGMGLVLGTRRLAAQAARRQIIRRALFLGLLGLLNALAFPPDILHFYACYFALGALCLRARPGILALAAALLPLLYLGLLLVLDYGRCWPWAAAP